MCSFWGSAERTARGYTRDYNANQVGGCGEAAKMLFKEDPYNQADGPYDASFKGYTMMDSGYDESTGIQRTTMKEAFQYKPKKYGPEPDSAPFTSSDW